MSKFMPCPIFMDIMMNLLKACQKWIYLMGQSTYIAWRLYRWRFTIFSSYLKNH